MTTPNFEEFDNDENQTDAGVLVEDEPEAELDEVDTPQASADDETETVSEPAKAEAAKEPKQPARPPVADGYITPVAAAKLLSEYAKKEIASQVMYSYVNQGKKANAKNPLKSYEVGGRQNLLKWDEVKAWWDAKEQRKVTRDAEKAEKAKAAAEKAAAPTAAPAEQTAPVVEAE